MGVRDHVGGEGWVRSQGRALWESRVGRGANREPNGVRSGAQIRPFRGSSRVGIISRLRGQPGGYEGTGRGPKSVLFLIKILIEEMS